MARGRFIGSIGTELGVRAESRAGGLELGGVKRLTTVRRVAAAWRGLCVGVGTEAGTVIGCSGGADSVGLVLALAAVARAGERVAVGHIVHDIRSREASEADRDFAAGLAERLGLAFFERRVSVPAGNAEGGARDERYKALAEMARVEGYAYVATAHHADDQLETMIMALIRGASLDGLAGIAPRRALGGGVELVRPMLHVSRRAVREICGVAGVGWQEDTTNADTTRTRSGLRHGAIEQILEGRADAGARAARCADHLHEAALVIRDRCEAVFGEGTEWARDALRGERALVVGAGVRSALQRAGGGMHMDKMTSAAIDPVVAAIRDGSGESRVFELAGGMRVEVTRDRVRVVRV